MNALSRVALCESFLAVARARWGGLGVVKVFLSQFRTMGVSISTALNCDI